MKMILSDLENKKIINLLDSLHFGKPKSIFEKKGMSLSGICRDRDLVEIIEIDSHPFFIMLQFHPELKNTVMQAHPIFISFVKAAMDYSKK